MALNAALPLTACVAVSASRSFPPSGRVLQLLWAFPKPLAKCRVPVPEMSQLPPAALVLTVLTL